MRIIDLMTGTVSALAMIARAPADDNDGEPLGMIELEDNLADAEKPPELPAGVYNGEVQDVQRQRSQKGNDYFAVKFVIPPDELPADLQEDFPDGAALYWNRQIVPKKGDRRALFNLRKFVEALGLDANTTNIDPNDWMGCTARVRIRHRTWEGENRAEISAIEAAEQAASTGSRGARGKQAAAEEAEEAPKRGGRGGGRRK
jgi:hypothetical protein